MFVCFYYYLLLLVCNIYLPLYIIVAILQILFYYNCFFVSYCWVTILLLLILFIHNCCHCSACLFLLLPNTRFADFLFIFIIFFFYCVLSVFPWNTLIRYCWASIKLYICTYKCMCVCIYMYIFMVSSCAPIHLGHTWEGCGASYICTYVFWISFAFKKYVKKNQNFFWSSHLVYYIFIKYWKKTRY